MDKSPKRRKHKDNPYEIIRSNNVNKVKFKDGSGKNRIIDITNDVFNAFNQFELEDISEMHEYERHTEHSELFDYSLEKRALNKTLSLEDYVIKKIEYEQILNELNLLPNIQKRRIKKYFFDNKTYEQIAREENCSKRAVKFSVDIGIEKISKNLKK